MKRTSNERLQKKANANASENENDGELEMSLDNYFYAHPESSSRATIKELVSKYEEKARLLLEEHKRELHEAFQAHEKNIPRMLPNIHNLGPSSKVYDLSCIGFDDEEGYRIGQDVTNTNAEAKLSNGQNSDTHRIEKSESVLREREITNGTSSHYVTEEQFKNEIGDVQGKLLSMDQNFQEKINILSQQQQEFQNLVVGANSQRVGGYLNSSDGFLANTLSLNNAQDNINSMTSGRHRSVTFLRMSTIISNGGFGVKLEGDTFSMMTITPPGSKAWLVGGSAFSFQMVLGVLIFQNLYATSENGNFFDAPFEVTTVVHVGQVLAIALCLSTQTDILTSIRSLVLMGTDSNWASVLGVEENDSVLQWILRIGIINVMKLVQGILVTLISLVIIIQANNIIDLLKDFTALMIISEVDNIIFNLAVYGYLGDDLYTVTQKVLHSDITGTNITKRVRFGVIFIRVVFLALLFAMFGVWGYIYISQTTGKFFGMKFDGCEAFDLVEKFGDNICYGGPLNTVECGFENGDCFNFNLDFPGCNGNKFKDIIDIEVLMKNEKCDPKLAVSECDYDAGACCPYTIQESDLFGDGICNGGKIASSLCGYDSGDCLGFSRHYPSCPIDEIAENKASGSVILGDGVCDSNLYATEDCGYEDKDCDVGQIGQDITFSGISSGNALSFRFEASADASTIVLGKHTTDINENFNETAPGIVSIIKYNSEERKWLEMEEFEGNSTSSRFGFGVATNVNGSIVAIGTPSDEGFLGNVRVLQFMEDQNKWQQFGQTLRGFRGNDVFGYLIDITDDGLRMAISSAFHNDTGRVQVFDMDVSQEKWDQVGQNIIGKVIGDYITASSMKLSPKDGSRVFFSRGFINRDTTTLAVYELNQTSIEWNQVGDDIENPHPVRFSPPAINGVGSRIAVSSHSDNPDLNGMVDVYDLNVNEDQIVWSKIFSLQDSKSNPAEGEGDGFGYSTSFSQDGNLLAVSSVKPACDGNPEFCPTGSVRLYQYGGARHNPKSLFASLPLKRVAGFGNVVQESERLADGDIVGLDVSLSRDGAKLSISGFGIENNNGFVKIYQTDDLFYPDCVVPDPQRIGDGGCDDTAPYNTEVCSFDGGDCRKPQQGLDPLFPDCFVVQPELLGNGLCYDHIPYNTIECNFDNGDCPEPKPVEGYPNCLVTFPSFLGNGICEDYPPYNSFDCGFDRGDCS